MKLFVRVLALTTAAALSACGSKQEGARTAPAPVVKGVKSEVLQLRPVAEDYEAVGTVAARSLATLSARTLGNVLAVRVREGDRVQAGQVLVEIDSRDVQSQADKAEAGLREAQEALAEVDAALRAADQAVAAARAQRDLAAATFTRFRTLLDRGSVSRQEFDEVDARRKAAEAELGRAAETREALAAKRRQVLAKTDQAKADQAGVRVALTYSRITSPVSGTVVSKPAEVGALAAPGVPLVVVEDDSRYRLEAAVEESRLAAVRVGDRVRVRVDALGEKEMTGRVDEVVPAADPASRTFLVKIGLERDRSLRAGLFGRAFFRAGERKALVVPRSAVVERGQLTGVFALDAGNVARLRLVKIGSAVSGAVEVLSGLTPGDRVVVEGAGKVTDGARVE